MTENITLTAALARTDEFLADLGHGTTSVRNMRELRALADAARAHLAETPELACSGVAPGRPRPTFSTAADHAAYAAARMNANGGMDDAEARAEGDAVVIEVHQLPAYRATFTCIANDCALHAHPREYTDAEYQAAFALVPKDPDGWKGEIDGIVPGDSDTEAMAAAISYYCGSPSDFARQPDGTIRVTAPGYYVCVGS